MSRNKTTQESQTKCSTVNNSPVHTDFIENLMDRKNEDGLNILEQAFFILFEHKQPNFVLYLLNNLPNIKSYLYRTNKQGWFPLFRVLHLFQKDIYESNVTAKKKEICQELLTTLFKIDYDFLRESRATFNKIENISTFEMLMTVPVEMEFFRQVLTHIWSFPIQQDGLLDMAMQIMKQKGQFVDFMYEVPTEHRDSFLNEMSIFLNNQKIMEKEEFCQ